MATPNEQLTAARLLAMLATFAVPEFDSDAAMRRYGTHPVVNKWFEWGETSDPSHKPLAISGAQEIALQDIIDAAIAGERERCAKAGFDQVIAIYKSEYEYSPLQKAAQVAAAIRGGK